MAAIRVTGNTFITAANLAAIESAAALGYYVVVRGADLKAVDGGSFTTLAFRLGGNKMRINVEDAGGGLQVGFVAQINNAAASESLAIDKADFTDADYYALFMRGGAAGLRLTVRDMAGALLGQSATGSTAALSTAGGTGSIDLVRPGGFSTNSPGCSVAGMAVVGGANLPADGSEHIEPAPGSCLALCRFDAPGSGSTITAVVGNDLQTVGNDGSPTTGGVTWLPGEGPWNGEGGGGGSAIAAISSGYHIRGMR